VSKIETQLAEHYEEIERLDQEWEGDLRVRDGGDEEPSKDLIRRWRAYSRSERRVLEEWKVELDRQNKGDSLGTSQSITGSRRALSRPTETSQLERQLDLALKTLRDRKFVPGTDVKYVQAIDELHREVFRLRKQGEIPAASPMVEKSRQEVQQLIGRVIGLAHELHEVEKSHVVNRRKVEELGGQAVQRAIEIQEGFRNLYQAQEDNMRFIRLLAALDRNYIETEQPPPLPKLLRSLDRLLVSLAAGVPRRMQFENDGQKRQYEELSAEWRRLVWPGISA
jgi:hypothetical protein